MVDVWIYHIKLKELCTVKGFFQTWAHQVHKMITNPNGSNED